MKIPKKSSSWWKILFFFLTNFSIIIIILSMISNQDENKKKEFISGALISFLTGFLASEIVVGIGVKSIKEHAEELKKEDRMDLYRFWTNELDQSKSNSKFTIVVVLDDGMNFDGKADLEIEIGIAKSLACFKICSILTEIYNNDVDINIEVIHGENQLNETIMDGNIIFIGCGSTSSTLRTIANILDLTHYQRIEDQNKRYFCISNYNNTEKYEPALHEISRTNPSDDTAVVTRISTTKQLIYIYNSHYSNGLLGGAVLTTNQQHLKTLNFINSIKKQSPNQNEPHNINHLLVPVMCSKDRRIDSLSYYKDLGLNFDFNRDFRQVEIGSIYTRIKNLTHKMISQSRR
jgi:hypothetical protein